MAGVRACHGRDRSDGIVNRGLCAGLGLTWVFVRLYAVDVASGVCWGGRVGSVLRLCHDGGFGDRRLHQLCVCLSGEIWTACFAGAAGGCVRGRSCVDCMAGREDIDANDALD